MVWNLFGSPRVETRCARLNVADQFARVFNVAVYIYIPKKFHIFKKKFYIQKNVGGFLNETRSARLYGNGIQHITSEYIISTMNLVFCHLWVVLFFAVLYQGILL